MATPTPNYNLLKPITGETYNVQLLDDNYDKIDTALGGHDKYAKGMVAILDNNTSSTGLGGTSVMCDLVQASLIQGRWYEMLYRVATTTTIANMAIAVALKKSVTSDSTATGTDPTNDSYTCYTAPVASQGSSLLISFIWKATATETVNLKMIMARATGSVTYDINGRHIALKDLGAQF